MKSKLLGHGFFPLDFKLPCPTGVQSLLNLLFIFELCFHMGQLLGNHRFNNLPNKTQSWSQAGFPAEDIPELRSHNRQDPTGRASIAEKSWRSCSPPQILVPGHTGLYR